VEPVLRTGGLLYGRVFPVRVLLSKSEMSKSKIGKKLAKNGKKLAKKLAKKIGEKNWRKKLAKKIGETVLFFI
jgi:hypothetical protein